MGTEPKASYMLEECSTSQAISSSFSPDRAFYVIWAILRLHIQLILPLSSLSSTLYRQMHGLQGGFIWLVYIIQTGGWAIQSWSSAHRGEWHEVGCLGSHKGVAESQRVSWGIHSLQSSLEGWRNWLSVLVRFGANANSNTADVLTSKECRRVGKNSPALCSDVFMSRILPTKGVAYSRGDLPSACILSGSSFTERSCLVDSRSSHTSLTQVLWFNLAFQPFFSPNCYPSLISFLSARFQSTE